MIIINNGRWQWINDQWIKMNNDNERKIIFDQIRDLVFFFLGIIKMRTKIMIKRKKKFMPSFGFFFFLGTIKSPSPSISIWFELELLLFMISFRGENDSGWEKIGYLEIKFALPNFGGFIGLTWTSDNTPSDSLSLSE